MWANDGKELFSDISMANSDSPQRWYVGVTLLKEVGHGLHCFGCFVTRWVPFSTMDRTGICLRVGILALRNGDTLGDCHNGSHFADICFGIVGDRGAMLYVVDEQHGANAKRHHGCPVPIKVPQEFLLCYKF